MKKSFITVLIMLMTLLLVSCGDINTPPSSKKIHFVSNGGTNVSSVTFETSFDASDLSAYVTTREGYTFINWHDKSDLTSVASGTYTKTTTFYAKWLLNVLEPITIEFDVDGGIEIEPLVLNRQFAASELDSIIPVKEGYDFISWHTAIPFTEENVASGVFEESTVFYAKFEVKVVVDTKHNFKSINDYQVENFGFSGLPSTGDIDVLVVPVEIKGNNFPNDYLTKLDTVFNGTSSSTGWESVASYYEKSSYGNLNLNFDVVSKYTTTNNRQYYQNQGEYGDSEAINETLVNIDNRVDFSNYDFNEDGIIDSIIFIYSVDFNIYDSDPWWAWVYIDEEPSYYDNKEFGYYMWASYHFMFDDLGSNVLLNAETYIHEMGHLFGLDDYYASNADYGYLGGFDMMDYNVGDHGPLNKLLLGWVAPTVISNSVTVNLDSFINYNNNQNKVIIIPKNNNTFDDEYGYSEYLVIMYYQPGGLYNTHLEAFVDIAPETSGIVVYHVEASIANDADFWDMFNNQTSEQTNKPFIQILMPNQATLYGSNQSFAYLFDNSYNKNLVNLSNKKWHDGSNMNIILNATYNNDVATINVTIN